MALVVLLTFCCVLVYNLPWLFRQSQIAHYIVYPCAILWYLIKWKTEQHTKLSEQFQWGSCYSIFSFICMFCRSLFDLLYFFWPLCCLLFFDIRILVVPLVSPNSSIEYRRNTQTWYQNPTLCITSHFPWLGTGTLTILILWDHTCCFLYIGWS